MSKFTIRNRASVITSDVEIKVFIKEQLTEAIQWLIERDFCFEYDVTKGDSIQLDVYSIRIPDLCWANNLEELAKVLGRSDYGSDEEKE